MDDAAAEERLRQLVSRETGERLRLFADLLIEENRRQNLISASSADGILTRHILDSAQLLRFAPAHAECWVDLGSGAGLPGIVLALMSGKPTILIENRALRVDWLRRVAALLDIANLRIAAVRAEAHPPMIANVITARAFAPLPRLFDAAAHLANRETVWILPKGRSAAQDLASARATWHGRFRMEPSETDPESAIIVADGVYRKTARR